MTASVPTESPAPPEAVLFEVAWEACHQVGGIYQVLRSKASVMSARWGDRYLVVGPRMRDSVELEIEHEKPSDWIADVVAELAREGWRVDCGRWLVAGRPRALLVDPELPPDRIESVRHRLARDFGIVPTRGDPLIDQALSFGESVRALLSTAFRVAARSGPPAPRRFVLQFHEWQGSVGLPLLRAEALPFASVFTTHATSVGRYVAGAGEDLYERLPFLEGNKEAHRLGIETQHTIERECARISDVFTTVSPITAEECDRLLGRAPDPITPNGLDIVRFDLGADFQTHHASYKEQIHRFVMAHFFPTYAFDLDRTLYFFNAGRFEPRNKGFDLCLEAMSRLNAELRSEASDLTVVFFIVTSRSVRSLAPRALHARAVLDDLDETSARIGAMIGDQIFRQAAAGQDSALRAPADEYWQMRYKRLRQAFRSNQAPLLCTHVLDDPAGDPVLAHLQHLGLTNSAEDRVKVVYSPEFISPANPLWGMDYEQFVRGCHLGVFPSSYEPWGYTPLECVAMGVPTITSDLTGFGRFVAGALPDHDGWGMAVLNRRGRDYHGAASDLTERLLAFCRLDRPARIALRNQLEAHSGVFDWSVLARAYHDAHDRALAASPGRP